MNKKRKTQGLVFLSLLLAILVNYPILRIFNKESMLGGFPLLYSYIFCAWLLFVILLWGFIRQSQRIK